MYCISRNHIDLQWKQWGMQPLQMEMQTKHLSLISTICIASIKRMANLRADLQMASKAATCLCKVVLKHIGKQKRFVMHLIAASYFCRAKLQYQRRSEGPNIEFVPPCIDQLPIEILMQRWICSFGDPLLNCAWWDFIKYSNRDIGIYFLRCCCR